MKKSWLSFFMLMLVTTPAVYAEEEEDEVLYPDVTPEECVNIRQIKKTKIVDDRNILFYMNGDKIFRNHLPRKCFGLKNRDSFSYKVSTARLCGIDIIRVLDRFGGGISAGSSCGLGKFYPITEEQAEVLLGNETIRSEPPEAPDDED